MIKKIIVQLNSNVFRYRKYTFGLKHFPANRTFDAHNL